jgi:hypothetical protein
MRQPAHARQFDAAITRCDRRAHRTGICRMHERERNERVAA